MGIATTVNELLQDGMDGAWAALPGFMSGIGLLLGAAIGLYFVMVLLSYMWTGEAAKLPIIDLFKRFFFLALMCAFALHADFYVEYVKTPVLAIPDEVGQLVSMNDMENGSILDSMIENNYKIIGDYWKPISEWGLFDINFGELFQFIAIFLVVGIVGTVFIVIAAAYLLIAKIMINVVLIIGPAFIMFGYFPPTREYLMKWVGVVLNYIFLVVIYAAVFTLLHNVLTSIDINSSQNALSALHPAAGALSGGSMATILLFVYLLFIGVIMAVPSMASSLTGGVGISPFGQVAQLLGAMSKLKVPKMLKVPGNTMGRTG